MREKNFESAIETNNSLLNISRAKSGVCCKRPKKMHGSWTLYDSKFNYQSCCVPVSEYGWTAEQRFWESFFLEYWPKTRLSSGIIEERRYEVHSLEFGQKLYKLNRLLLG